MVGSNDRVDIVNTVINSVFRSLVFQTERWVLTDLQQGNRTGFGTRPQHREGPRGEYPGKNWAPRQNRGRCDRDPP